MKDIEFSYIDVDSDISILIGADNPLLYLYTDIHVGSKNETGAQNKAWLGYFFFGGGGGGVRIIINVFPNKFDLGNMVSNFGK